MSAFSNTEAERLQGRAQRRGARLEETTPVQSSQRWYSLRQSCVLKLRIRTALLLSPKERVS